MAQLNLLAAKNQGRNCRLYSVSVISLAAQANVYGLRNDYAFYEVTSDGVDTVGVWGSNPHASTIFMSKPLLPDPRSTCAFVSISLDFRRRAASASSIRSRMIGTSDFWPRVSIKSLIAVTDPSRG